MPLSELCRDCAPLPYEDARAFFEKDMSCRWAAYVAGCYLVLMHEVGVTFEKEQSYAILVSSDVPDGAWHVHASASMRSALILHSPPRQAKRKVAMHVSSAAGGAARQVTTSAI